MECSNCSEEAIYRVDWKGKNYCSNHYKRYFLGQVNKVLDKYDVTGRGLVAVSGGKDSSSCLEALTHFGEIEVEAFFIDLGIGEHSKKSLNHVRELTEKIGIELNVLDLESKYGATIPELSERENSKPCSICGMVKRYLMNRFAYENNFDFVATGHNLSDEVSSTFNNLANVYLTPFRGLEPVLEENEKYKLVKRVKPLYFLKDEECLTYAEDNSIPFHEEECPLSEGSPTNELKEWLHNLDSKKPKIMRNFAKSFVRIEKRMKTDQSELRNCKNCGFATATETCRFCRVVGN